MRLPDNILALPLPLGHRVLLAYLASQPGDVPSVRALADVLGLSRSQVHRALKDLAAQGYLEGKGYKKTIKFYELVASGCPNVGQQVSQYGTVVRRLAGPLSQCGTVVERNERPNVGQHVSISIDKCPNVGQYTALTEQDKPQKEAGNAESVNEVSHIGTALQEGGVIEYNRNINTYKRNTNTVNTVETKDEKTPSEKAEKKKRTDPTEFDRKSAKAFRELFRAWGLAVSGNQDAQHIRRLRASLPDDAEGHIRGAYLYLKSRGMASHGEHLVEIQSCRALKEKFAKLQAEMKRKSITHEQRNQSQFDPASRLAQLKASRQTGVSE